MALLDDLKQGKILVSDGATGTLLQEQGLGPGECSEEWNISHPEIVTSIARGYFEAGSDMVSTNTCGALRNKLKLFGYPKQVEEFATAGVRLARRVCPKGRYVLGSVGPTGEFLLPVGEVDEETMSNFFAEPIDVFAREGVDAILFETFYGIEEAELAVRTARERTNLPIFCTLSFEVTPGGIFSTMGVRPAQAAEALQRVGADVVGTNCGNGMEKMIPIVKQMREATDLPILVHANAGLPRVVDGRTCFLESPELMRRFTPALIEAGASIIGGCCGTTPDHIRAIREMVDKGLPPAR